MSDLNQGHEQQTARDMEEKTMTTVNEKSTTLRFGNHETTWSDLLRDAVSTPGKLLEAYTAFHNFSIGNAVLAMFQCCIRDLKPGPLNTYKGWQKLGRQVTKGEKARSLNFWSGAVAFRTFRVARLRIFDKSISASKCCTSVLFPQLRPQPQAISVSDSFAKLFVHPILLKDNGHSH